MDFLLFKKPEQGGRNMQRYFKLPSIPAANDISKIQNGLEYMDCLIDKLNATLDTIITGWKLHMTGDNTPKPYASGEKSKYVTDTLTHISKMESHKSKLEDTLGKLRNKYTQRDQKNRF